MTLFRTLLALSLLVLALACGVDDSSIDNKQCDVSKPVQEQCITGYTCDCTKSSDGKCYCLPLNK
ncbi:MAG: hypothetical protein H6707_04785 [Deltaproteobacteria bacterium]|nr:hypothetical protein [Deltaproteobacteria bacterium]